MYPFYRKRLQDAVADVETKGQQKSRAGPGRTKSRETQSIYNQQLTENRPGVFTRTISCNALDISCLHFTVAAPSRQACSDAVAVGEHRGRAPGRKAVLFFNLLIYKQLCINLRVNARSSVINTLIICGLAEMHIIGGRYSLRRNAVGDSPAWVLKYLRKVNCSGKPSFSAISLTERSVWDSRCFAWPIAKETILRIGVCPEYYERREAPEWPRPWDVAS